VTGNAFRHSVTDLISASNGVYWFLLYFQFPMVCNEILWNFTTSFIVIRCSSFRFDTVAMFLLYKEMVEQRIISKERELNEDFWDMVESEVIVETGGNEDGL
jgi:hypothetical protein